MNPTNSLVNNIYANDTACLPTIGMGATALKYTDRMAYTIVSVKKNEFVARRDNAKRIDNNGMSDTQTYEYSSDPTGLETVVTRRRNGKWVTKGEGLKHGTHWLVGKRDEYFDHSF